MKTCNAEQYNGKLWIPEDCTAAFEEQQIPLTACYTALSCKECGVHKIRIFKVSLLCCVNRLPKCNMKLCTITAHVHFCSHLAEDAFKTKMQHTMCVSMQNSTSCTQFYMRWLLLEVFFFFFYHLRRQRKRENRSNYCVSLLHSILLSPLCSSRQCIPETWQELPMILLIYRQFLSVCARRFHSSRRSSVPVL